MRPPGRYRLAALLLMAASMAAVAQPGPRGERFDGPRGEPRQERMQPGGGMGGMGDPRGGPARMREFRGNAEGDARGGQEDARRRDERMSPDERRQLRRDIHDAGRDIYRPRPRRFEQQ